MVKTKTRRLALIEGATAGTLFGTAAIFIRYLGDLDSFSISFWRLIVAFLVLALISFVLSRRLELGLMRKSLKELCLLGVFLGLHFLLFVSAVKDTTILNATVLVNTTPIFSVVVSSFVFKSKPTSFALTGLFISFLGICLIAYAETTGIRGNADFPGFSPSLKGDLEAISAAFVEALYLNYGRRLRQQMGILSIMGSIYLLGAAVVLVFGVFAAGSSFSVPFQFTSVLPLVALGIIPTAVSHTLYFSSLSNLKSFETATMALLEPIGAAILGIGLFQEIPASLFVLGAVLVFAGIFFVIKDKPATNK